MTTKLSERLRELRENLRASIQLSGWAEDILEKCIAQAEARDKAMEALEITWRALASYESGIPIKVDDLRKWNAQAISALRG